MGLLTVLFINLAFLFVYSTTFTMVMPLAAAEYGVSEAVIGLLFTFGTAIPFILDVPVSALADRIEKKKLIRIGLIGCVISSLIPILFPNKAGIISGYILYKLMTLCYSLPLLSMISLCGGKTISQARVQGWNGFIQGACSMGASMLAGVLKDHLGITATYYVIFAAAVLAFVAATFIREMPVEHTEPVKKNYSFIGSFRSAFKMLRENTFIQRAALVEMMNSFVIYGVYQSYFSLYVTNHMLFTASFLGVLLSVRILVSTFMNLLYPRISAKFGRFMPSAVFFGAACLLFIVLPQMRTEPMLMIWVILVGAGAGLSPAAPNTLIGEGCKPENRALGFATVSIAAGCFGTVFNLLFSWLAGVTDLGSVFRVSGILGIIFIIGAVLYNNLVLEKKQSAQG